MSLDMPDTNIARFPERPRPVDLVLKEIRDEVFPRVERWKLKKRRQQMLARLWSWAWKGSICVVTLGLATTYVASHIGWLRAGTCMLAGVAIATLAIRFDRRVW